MNIQKFLRVLPFFRVRGKRAFLEIIIVQAILVLAGPIIMKIQPGSSSETKFPGVDTALFLMLYIGCSILWGALRWRLRPALRSRWLQLLIEVEMSGVVLLEFLMSFMLIVTTLHLFTTFHIALFSSSGYMLKYTFNDVFSRPIIYGMALSCGFTFFMLRLAVRIWLFWNKLRHTRLRWALTHAHLMVVVIGACVISVLSVFLAPGGRGIIIIPFMLVLTGIVLACVLPPSALFSYIFARQTTRRIEKLAAATSALRNGNYGIRVHVEGEDEIAHLQSDFNAMAADLERAMHALQEERDNVATLLHAHRELIASVSHELRTPVATVRSYLESTLSNWKEQPPATLRQDLSVIEQQTIRLQSLINDLFTLARAEVKRLDMRCVPSNVELLVKRVTETAAPVVWRSSRVEVLADIDHVQPVFPLALVDENRLEQVLQNLLHNGVRHTSPGGIIIISASIEPQMLRLEVKDTGEGIPAEELAHIWERFYRTERARMHPGSGTGLGLAIVKELTEAMGGTVSVMSILGQGSCFTIRVPLVPQQEDPSQQAFYANQPVVNAKIDL